MTYAESMHANRLSIYAGAFLALYAVFLIVIFLQGEWIVDRGGRPIPIDFMPVYLAGGEALHGHAAAVYDLSEFRKAQLAFVGEVGSYYPWPYPPTFFLVLAPLSLLPYPAAFALWEGLTLCLCLAVVFVIVRRPITIAVALASPAALWNFLAGQNGFLTAALIGGALWLLERRPLLAGVAMGLLTYKPQFGLLFPLALAVTAQWRAFAAAAATAALLAGASAVTFGVSSWRAFPAALTEHGDSIFVLGELRWEKVETVFGLTRAMGSGPELAFGAQLATGILVAGAVYLAWRSSAPYSLKSALLAAGALAVTPYAFAYDFAALAIPVAFLAKDQIASGSLKGEQAVLVWICFGLVVIVLPINVPPLGPAMVAALIVLIVRRMIWHAQRRVLVDQGAAGSRNGGAGGDNIVW